MNSFVHFLKINVNARYSKLLMPIKYPGRTFQRYFISSFSAEPREKMEYDVVTVGGGPAGFLIILSLFRLYYFK
jgi:hypothetical protein